MAVNRLGAVALLLTVVTMTAGCTGSSDSPIVAPTTTATTTTAPKPVARTPVARIELADPVLVMNPHGSATLSATLINHTHEDHEILALTVERDGLAAQTRAFRLGGFSILKHDRSVTIGTLGSIQLQVDGPVATGQTYDIRLKTRSYHHEADPITVSAKAAVVARTDAYDTVAGAKPNPYITVEDGRIVVVPGQAKAYVGGTIVSTIDDASYGMPTARDAAGRPVTYRHQTATGGPGGVAAFKGRRLELGGPPFRAVEGDADYIDAADVHIGQKLTVTFAFASGNVDAIFTVVAG